MSNGSKPFLINKNDVWNAWLQVKRNKGAEGIDGISIEMYELDLKNNLYKLWNSMSSGTYFPVEVRNVKIPKGKNEFRKLGIPTVNDRIAQTIVANILNVKVDPTFHKDSYGFRPNKSTHQALEITTKRCFENSYVINLDIKGLFDNIPHEYIYKSLEKFELEKWVNIYIKRWLEISDVDNTACGTPQGGVISPILANLFMDICFDKWMQVHHKNIKFARYADDVVLHCASEKQTLFILKMVEVRFNKCGIELNKSKTRLASTRCIKSTMIPSISFDFLGFTFKPTKCKNRNTKEYFVGFLPTPSIKSKVKMNTKIEETKLFRNTQLDINYISKVMNPIIRGWCNYYGHFNNRAMVPVCNLIDNKIAKFMKKKHKNIKSHGKAYDLVRKLKKQNPNLFYHWEFVRY